MLLRSYMFCIWSMLPVFSRVQVTHWLLLLFVYYFSYFMFLAVFVYFPCLVFVPELHSFDFRYNFNALDYTWTFTFKTNQANLSKWKALTLARISYTIYTFLPKKCNNRMATLVQCCFKLIQGDVFVGGEYVNDTYRWKSTGETLNTSLWAPYQPSSQEKCIQLWQKWGGLDDT